MITFPTNRLIIEGPDLSGKSSLYSAIHKASGFRWNLQDRSFLSMLVYAKMYNRPTGLHAKGFWEEICNLNNRIVFLLPDSDVLLERYESRGDDIQDEESLLKVYDLFEEHSWLGNFPNVWPNPPGSDVADAADYVASWLSSKENTSVQKLAEEAARFVANMPRKSLTSMKGTDACLEFEFYESGEFEDVKSKKDVFEDPDEGDYHRRIYNELYRKISREAAGNNEYNESQGPESRRFVWASDTCISFIQFRVLSNGSLSIDVVFRSSNVAKTFVKDLNFIYWLGYQIREDFGFLKTSKPVHFTIKMKSAHAVR